MQSTQKGEIGIAVSTVWLIPQSDTRENRQAAQRGIDFSVGWLVLCFHLLIFKTHINLAHIK